MKKDRLKRPMALLLCAALLASGIGTSVYAINAGQANQEENAPAAPETAGQSVLQAEADGTVYILTGTDGTAREMIVDDQAKDALGSENFKTGQAAAEGELPVWDLQKQALYCGDGAEKAAPVTMRVSYKLDGKDIRPEDLQGKSGRVSIRFDYENNQCELVEIDGRQEEMHVPFVALTGILLDGEVFSNIEVSNGKLVNDGDRSAVVGIAFPGLQSNLALDQEKLEIPDYVEIRADARAFSLGNTFTLVSSQLFTKLDGADGEGLGSVEELSGALDQMLDAMDALIGGSDQLYDGLDTLLEKSGELVNGIDRLAAGASALETGAGSLSQGAAGLASGSEELAAGLDALNEKSGALTAGAEQVYSAMLAAANQELAAAAPGLPALTAENYGQVLGAAIAAADESSAAALSALKAQLDGFAGLYQGLCQYTAGVAAAQSGAGQLQAGAAQLQEGATGLQAGAKELNGGLQTLKSGAPALVQGVTELRDGQLQLSGGLRALQEDGVEKLVDAVNGDLSGLLARLRATAALAKRSGGLSGGIEAGQVKFIYRTDALQGE